MKTLTLSLPDSLNESRNETIQFLAAKLYESEKLTLNEAAIMCEMKKWEFAEILIKYDVHFLDASAMADLKNGK
ncbi:UPF0175 family protein [Pedobacter sp. SD-b]|uniref:UPF0175 family protein n=1 Tax=Pedobacter segetis TaxID=2793069 RepID=A0ABS1BHD8_9SPHI|nr:UPF0175 family protein [Pedobacter segetis]MBK0382274.1 UPF0175 family protein [Pedobacter segetis]